MKSKAAIMLKIKGWRKYFPKGKNGSLSKLLYVIPLLIWMLCGVVVLAKGDFTRGERTNNKKRVNVVKGNDKAIAVAGNLQDDINFISEQKGDTKLFDQSKKEIIKANAKESFLMETMIRQAERSVWAKSMGTEDEMEKEKESTENVADSTRIKEELNYEMESYKYESDRPAGNAEKEKARVANMEVGRSENRRRREEMEEESTLKAEAEAYRKGAEDYAKVTKSFSMDDADLKGEARAKDKKIRVAGLSFHTQTGTKDDLKKGVQKSEEEVFLEMLEASLKAGTVETSGEAAIETTAEKEEDRIVVTNKLQILEGTIDQGTKLKAGDKVQIRVLEKGFYRGHEIPANTTLYGICSISGNRIKIEVPSIRLDEGLIKSSLKVYDPDGLEGIYVDGFYNDFTKGIINEGLGEGANLGVKLPFSNMSLKLGRKANNRASAYIPSGYKVLLYDSGKSKKSVTFNYQHTEE